jgi:type I restriction enzyme S subunit
VTSAVAYPSYKVVDARWLKSVPALWDVVRLRYLCDITTGSGDTQDANPDGEYPFVVRSPTPLRSAEYSFETEAILTAGDGALVGRAFLHLNGKFHAHQRVYVLTNFKHVDTRFLYYYFSSLFRLMTSDGSAKTTVDSVRRWMLADMPVAVPQVSDQRVIADFLDRETGHLDDLIAKQEELVRVLRERRTAVIDRIVWSGLSVDTPSSPTRIDTVPGAPSHWARLRNKDVFRERVGVSADGGEELLTVSHITGVTPRSEKNVNMFEAESLEGYKIVRVGDLAINTMWAWMGALGVSGYEGIVSPSYGVYEPRQGVAYLAQYFDYIYRSSPYVVEMTRNSRGITSSRLRLYPDVFLRLPIVVPPVEEQMEMVAFVEAKVAGIDRLISRAERHIEFAQERKAALITAAVTGQIDVTGRG